MPRPVATGITRRPDDPLAPYAAAVLRATSRGNRLHDSSALTLVIDALRAAGSDPLDTSISQLDAILPVGSRKRTRAWRPFARFLRAAELAGALGPQGRALLARMAAGPAGRRDYLSAYTAFTRVIGLDPATAPAEVREDFLSALGARDTTGVLVDRTRAAIRRLERSAVVDGRRPQILPRHGRLVRAFIEAGAAGESEALELIAAAHHGYAPSVHRWADAVLARYLRFCSEQGIPALAAGLGDVAAFRAAHGDALGIGPVRRMLTAAHGGGRDSCVSTIPAEAPTYDCPSL